MARPRKYKDDAERQAAFRERNTLGEFRVKPETMATLDSIAAELDVPRTELVASMLKFALLNRNWREGLFGPLLPSAVRPKPARP